MDDLIYGHPVVGIAIERKSVSCIEQRLEERQTDDVIKMEMGEKDVEIPTVWSRIGERLLKLVDTGPCIKHDMRTAATVDGDARRVATVPGGFGTSDRHGPPHAPKMQMTRHSFLPSDREASGNQPRLLGSVAPARVHANRIVLGGRELPHEVRHH